MFQYLDPIRSCPSGLLQLHQSVSSGRIACAAPNEKYIKPWPSRPSPLRWLSESIHFHRLHARDERIHRVRVRCNTSFLVTPVLGREGLYHFWFISFLFSFSLMIFHRYQKTVRNPLFRYIWFQIFNYKSIDDKQYKSVIIAISYIYTLPP